MTGTDSTPNAFASAKLTLTDAWSRPAPVWCPRSAIVTGIVADELELELDAPLLEPLALLVCATGLTAVMTPLTTLPFGISTVTCSPRTASLCELALRSTVTISCVEVVCRIAVALPPALEDDPDEEEPLLAAEPEPAPLEALLDPPLRLAPDEPDELVRAPAVREELAPVPVFEDAPDFACALTNAINACSVSCSTDSLEVELELGLLPPFPLLDVDVDVLLVVVV